MKNIEEMSDHELLMELVAEKRRQDKLRYLKYAFYGLIGLAFVVLCYIYVPKIVEMYKAYKQMVDKVNELTSQLQGTSDKINSLIDDVSDGTIEKLKSLVDVLNSVLGRFGF
ncbi:MAG: hypothetical protein IJI46_06835 [Erysipelotrichaceae bacterium]|nr:hypothetical protein [Erysipelotrichaceae bacterium]